ncbi:hypothetical protein PACTADRAFT_47523 [Pachysolen tannophilus NRRL Y-2460]|uniref:SMP-30/Gluconolactonase/LRE-like region domain-containing protein n=1 Tax=Pachysolen tannophilus NRRL Y-2460 TaxID=669874 RepID=A0A1E4U0Y2_PACTA|nr:hypothetical protein PACTADRAFT_47523 [Pachysolen tannophilus NRRL Y-2460]
MVEAKYGGNPFYMLNRPCVLGEAPIYRESDSTLHYVDVFHDPPQLHILSLDPTTGDALYPNDEPDISKAISLQKDNVSIPGLRVLNLKESITVQCFRKGIENSYICAYHQGVGFLDEKTGEMEVAKELIPLNEKHLKRFNDGAVDCKGRFWLAEIDFNLKNFSGKYSEYAPSKHGKATGKLWRYDPNGDATTMDEGIICGNGLGWSPDNKIFYMNDSIPQLVYAYDFDSETGNISNKRVFVDRKLEGGGEPDGMVVDIDGNLWISMFGISSVAVYNPNGELIKTLKFGAKKLTCPTWGGKDHNIMYVVSSYDTDENKDENDYGGQLFKYHTDTTGLRKNEFAG